MTIERGWVIEGAWSPASAPEYWRGGPLWSGDHMEAIRFAREQDAKQAAFMMLAGMNVRIAAHEWENGVLPEPDWFWCAIDPDESGDSAYEAMFHHRGRLSVVELHSSYQGPTLWGVMVPPLPTADTDEEEARIFLTAREAEDFCIEQRALREKTEAAS